MRDYVLHYENLLNDFKNMESLLFKFMYLGSFAGSNNILKHNGRCMKKRDIISVLSLSRKIGTEIINDLLHYNLIYIEDEVYIVNSKYLSFDKIKNGDIFVSVYGIRELYNKSGYRNHKIFGHFLYLFKYIDPQLNILCFNSGERSLKLKELSELFGVDGTNSNRLKSKLTNMTVNKIPVITYFNEDFRGKLLKFFIVNPLLFHKSEDIDHIVNFICNYQSEED